MTQSILVNGNTVQLKSGGPLMTVIAIGPGRHGTRAEPIRVPEGHVLATWFDNGQQKHGVFLIDALQVVVQKA